MRCTAQLSIFKATGAAFARINPNIILVRKKTLCGYFEVGPHC